MLSLLAMSILAYPTPIEHDFAVENFQFANGQKLEKLNLHCTTIGEPKRNPTTGKVDNAVLIMHGTGGTGHQFITPIFADQLFGPGQPLDATKYYIILPDAIGHGKSTKPSNGLHAKFPNYRYADIVRAQHMVVFDFLKVDHLRLVMGTSMGGMQTWVWGETYPNDMSALMPLACAPIEIAGRNRTVRKMAIDGIRKDPEWMGGEYTTQPRSGLTFAANSLMIMGSSALTMLKLYPTAKAADDQYERTIANYMRTLDANDFLYQFEASEDYKPNADLEKIVAPLTWVNSADDFINPPELEVERDIKRVKDGQFVMLPITEKTRGHGTHTIAEIWKTHLVDLLRRTEPKS